MKKSTARQEKPQTTRFIRRNPENKDDIDSRKNEEQEFKGDDITHNKKEVKVRKQNLHK
jgi:hypothetical protein